jgi:predicted amidohydrolase
MAPRIAVSQFPYLGDVAQSLERTLDSMRQAASRGAELVVFPEWFLGVNPVDILPNRLTERIAQAARELSLTVVTGSLRVLDEATGKKQQRGLVINRDGTIAGSQSKIRFSPREQPWFEPGLAITAIPSDAGTVVILLGQDGSDPARWDEVRSQGPDLVVMAHSFESASARADVQALAVARSREIDGTVVLAPLLGRFLGVGYVPGALIAERGRILSASDRDGLMIAGDPEAPLIQLGATDVAAYVPPSGQAATPPPDPLTALGSEAERRVLIDWNALLGADTVSAGQTLLAKAAENARMVALAPARPFQSDQLDQLLNQGACGAFAYPGLDRVHPWEESVRALGQVLERHARPLLVHTGPGRAPLRFDCPSAWDEFLQEFPSVPLVLVHMGGRPPLLEEALLLAERHRQVFLETSGVPMPLIQAAIQELGRDRVVFGSGGIPDQFRHEWQKFGALEPRIGTEAFQAVVNKNARRLFFEPVSGALRSMTGPGLSVIRRPS